MSNETAKKVLGIVSKVLTWILIAATVAMMIFTIFSTLTFDRNDRNLFGMRFYIVLSDSMSPSENNKNDKIHFNAGDIVVIKTVEDSRTLQPGDVIAFVSQNEESRGQTVTHMIRERRVTSDGKLIGYVTYGTNTGENDKTIVEPESVLGQYTGKLPGVGRFFAFLKTTPGYIVCILVPFLLLILYQGVNTVRLFKRYKREQLEEMEQERAKIDKERQQSMDMMRELQLLREQLAAQQSSAQAAPASEAEPKTDASAETPTAPVETKNETESKTAASEEAPAAPVLNGSEEKGDNPQVPSQGEEQP